MKKTLILFAMVCVLSLSVCLTAFAESTVDFSVYPEDFSAWTMADMKGYLRACGLMENDSWFFDMTGGDLDFSHATAGTIYMDFETASILDIIFQYDVSDPEAEAILNGICEAQKLVLNGDEENAQDIDAVLGSFCFQYLMGYDEAHLTGLCQAIRDLGEHYGIEPVYVNEW